MTDSVTNASGDFIVMGYTKGDAITITGVATRWQRFTHWLRFMLTRRVRFPPDDRGEYMVVDVTASAIDVVISDEPQ